MVFKRHHDLSVADVVRLKCGGFPMIVHRVRGNRITCVWQHIQGEPFKRTYDARLLCRVADEPRLAPAPQG